MGIITLTTDSGYKDFYVAVIKGTVLQQLPSIQIIDINHQITPFDIQQSAFVLGNAYHAFPKGTVHFLGVSASPGWQQPLIAMEADGHFFVGGDNGIFSLMNIRPTKIVTLTKGADQRSGTVLANAACHLALGKPIEELGPVKESLYERSMFRPVSEPDVLRGTVIYIDNFGNVISNISKEVFEQTRAGRKFQINLKKSDYILDSISRSYNDVPEGEKLALFGNSGNLEISINKGNASGLLNLRLNDPLRIEFE